jgi:hypothetical protein
MHKAKWLIAALLALGLVSCRDNTTAPRAVPPAAPRGLYSTTGDQSVTLRWLANTETNVAGYRIYQSTCATTCPYTRIGTSTGTSFLVTGLANGVTRFFAVAAVDGAGNESDLSYETVYDTPRPEGIGAAMVNFRPDSVLGTGWDFPAMRSRLWSSPLVDIVYSRLGGFAEIYAADASTDIQDAGYATTLDAVDFAPAAGWSPTGAVEAIVGHCYVVWTRDNHFAKLRVTSATAGSVIFDWAYQTDPGNGELRARRAGHGSANARQAVVTQRLNPVAVR